MKYFFGLGVLLSVLSCSNILPGQGKTEKEKRKDKMQKCLAAIALYCGRGGQEIPDDSKAQYCGSSVFVSVECWGEHM